MLHRIEVAGCANELLRIVDLMHEVLKFACDPNNADPPTENAVRTHFTIAPDWIWKKLWNGKPGRRPSRIQNQVRSVAQLVRKDPSLATKILDAFEQDIEFHQHVTSNDFRFQYPARLDKATRAVVGALAVSFYSDQLKAGYPATVHGGQGELSIRSFKQSFWAVNRRLMVCPYCDREKPDVSRGRSTSSGDHFFPKSKYPFLSVHPRNLVPVCAECNEKVKLGNDPIRDHGQHPMLGVFHPYVDTPACKCLKVAITEDQRQQELVVTISDGDKTDSPRLKSLTHILDLEERWTNRLEAVIERVQNDVARLALNDQAHPAKSKEELRKRLVEWEELIWENLGREPNTILVASYLAFAHQNDFTLTRLHAKYIEDWSQRKVA